MPKPMDIEINGDTITLKREQWIGNVAYISNYPGLLDEVKKYTWTYTKGDHPYLNCSKLKISLHKFVPIFALFSHAGLYSIFNSLAQFRAHRCHKIEIFVLFTTLFAFAFLLCI